MELIFNFTMIGKNNIKNIKNLDGDEKINLNNNLFSDSNNFTNSTLRSALDYYDRNQEKIQKILDNIEYIKMIDGGNINDEYIFYDKNDNIIFKSRIETLSIYAPQNNIWKWSWSVPFAKFQNTFISRKILEYAFTLNSDTDLFLKSTLVSSKIIISNQYQIDLYLALSALLSKKPFILRFYLFPGDDNEEDENIYHYKKILNHPDKKNFMSVYSLMIDWNEIV